MEVKLRAASLQSQQEGVRSSKPSWDTKQDWEGRKGASRMLTEKTGGLRGDARVPPGRESKEPTPPHLFSNTQWGRGTTKSYLSSDYRKLWVRLYSQPKEFLAMWTEVVGDGVGRPHHFRNHLMLRTVWCYDITKCTEVPEGGEGKSGWAGCRRSLWEAGFPEGPA